MGIATTLIDLKERVDALVKQYLPELIDFPSQVLLMWGDLANIDSYGFCLSRCEVPAIIVDNRASQTPDWVVDAILVHELAHLIEPEHNALHAALANRHPRQGEVIELLGREQRQWEES